MISRFTQLIKVRSCVMTSHASICRKSAYRLIARNIVYLIFLRFVKVFNLKYKQKLVYLSIPDLLFGIVSVLLQDRNQLALVIFAKGYSVDQHVLLNDEILVRD